jgi:ABC-2 type transport system ATP-binding protein
MELITVSGLTMQFGNHRALDNVDFTVHSGVTGLVGANGAGKTTFMSIALGLRKPTQGTIRVLALEPIKQGAELRSLVSYGPERNILPDEMPAVDFVKHLAEVRGIPRKEAKTRASDVLWLVGLGEERFRPIGTMSTGQRQRVKLAQAIAADPKLVFLDEPTDGLDPLARDEVLTLIRQVSEEYGIHIMISSHLLEEVEQICDNIVVLNAGKLVVAGQLNQLTGQSTGLEVELVSIDDRPDAINAVERSLREAGLTVIREADSPVLRIQDETFETPSNLIRDAVADAGARLHRIQHRRRSLEDIILDTSS